MPNTTTSRGASHSRHDTPAEYTGYTVRAPYGRKIGTARGVFTNAHDEPEYVKVKTGLFGLKSILLPVRTVVGNEKRRSLTLG